MDPRLDLGQTGGLADGREQLLVAHGAAAAAQHPGSHDHARVHLAVDHGAMLEEDRLVVVTDEARLDVEALPQLQRLAEGDGLARDDGVPAARVHRVEQTGADQQSPPAEVEQRQVAAVVHVPEDVDVGGQGRQSDAADRRRLERAAAPSAQPGLQDDEKGAPDHIHKGR